MPDNPFEQFDPKPDNPFAQFDRPGLQPPKPMMSGLQRFGTGLMDPVQGTAQTLSHIVPWGGTLDEQTREREADIQATTPKPADVVTTTTDTQGRGVHSSPQPSNAKMPDPDRILGNMLSPMNLVPPAKVLRGTGILARTGNAAIQGAGVGAMQPVATKDFLSEKAIQVGTGGVVGGVLPAAEAGVKSAVNSVGRWLSGIKGEDAIKDKAAQAILSRIASDKSGGGPTTQDMLDLINATPGKPLTVADVGGENLRALVGKIARQPGDARQIITAFLKERDLNAGLRMDRDVVDTMGMGGQGAYDTFEAMKQGRSIAAKPLFDKAYEGGSLAPLKDQFETGFREAGRAEAEAQRDVQHAQSRITQASARQSQGGNDVYAASGANQNMRAAQAELQAAQTKLAAASKAKQDILEFVHQAQDDIASNRPGAVWSPRIQQFLDTPEVQQGIKHGWQMERREAVADGRTMNPSEYAVTGVDQEGNPIVGKVPTMRLLAVAKEGLDKIIGSAEMTNPLTGELTKDGITYDKLRRSLTEELDRLNPDYKAARAQWGGDTVSMTALKDGERFMAKTPDEIAAAVKAMSPSDKEFYKLGASSALRKMIGRTGSQGNEALKIGGENPNAWIRRQIRPLFDSEEAFDKYIGSVTAEDMMFRTKQAALGNSPTAARLADDASSLDLASTAAHGVHAGMLASHGFLPGAIYHGSRILEHVLPKGDPKVSAEIARFLQLPGPEQVSRLNAATRGVQPNVTPYLVPPAVVQTTPTQP